MNPFIYIAIYIITLVLLAVIIGYIGRVNAQRERYVLQYDIMYMNLETIIDTWQVTENSYYAIWEFFCTMRKLPYQNHEKTDVLMNKFLVKYQEIKRQILQSEDEFGVTSICFWRFYKHNHN